MAFPSAGRVEVALALRAVGAPDGVIVAAAAWVLLFSLERCVADTEIVFNPRRSEANGVFFANIGATMRNAGVAASLANARAVASDDVAVC